MIDFMIMEAVSARIYKEEAGTKKQQQVAAWKRDPEGLARLKNMAGG